MIGNTMNIKENRHFLAAYESYMQALQMRRAGLLGNAGIQREQLRAIYRLLAGK
jgi:hypothetical protein